MNRPKPPQRPSARPTRVSGPPAPEVWRPKRRPPTPPRRPARPRWRTASLVALSAGIALYVVASLQGDLPWQVGVYCALMSTLCYGAYMSDKEATRHGTWRTRESVLLGLGLAGGWPGAVIAQEVLRHKSSKVTFRRRFWLTVWLNWAAFALLFTPILAPWTPLYPLP